MICPQCGFDMGTRHRCLRCGYEIKTLVQVDEEEQKRRNKDAAKVIDPNNTYLTDEYGNLVDDDDVFDPFGSLLENILGFDPFADLFGGFFGMGSAPRKRKRKEVYMDRIHEPGEDDGKPKIVEVDNVEVVDDKSKTKKKSNGSDDRSDGKNKK